MKSKQFTRNGKRAITIGKRMIYFNDTWPRRCNVKDEKPKDEKNLSALIHEADNIFSKYIRRRDADPNYPFFLRCFTCGKKERIEFAHAMHFIDRDQMAVRYEEMNVHGGCEECNCFDTDHHKKYEAKMIHIYGADAVEALKWKSRSLAKFMRLELVSIIEIYKGKLKALK